MSKKNKSIEESFISRSEGRRNLATVFLIISVFVMGYGAFAVISQMNDFMSKSSMGVTPNFKEANEIQSKNDGLVLENSNLSKNDNLNSISNLLARLVLISIVFYVAQIFVRLYKYNTSKSDFYRSCADGLKISKELDDNALAKFDMALKAMNLKSIDFEDPEKKEMESQKALKASNRVDGREP